MIGHCNTNQAVHSPQRVPQRSDPATQIPDQAVQPTGKLKHTKGQKTKQIQQQQQQKPPILIKRYNFRQ